MSAITEGFQAIPVYLGADLDRIVYCERANASGTLIPWDFNGDTAGGPYSAFWGAITDSYTSPTYTTDLTVDIPSADEFGTALATGEIRVYCSQENLAVWETLASAAHPSGLKVYADLYGRDAAGNDDLIGRGTFLLYPAIATAP